MRSSCFMSHMCCVCVCMYALAFMFTEVEIKSHAPMGLLAPYAIISELCSVDCCCLMLHTIT